MVRRTLGPSCWFPAAAVLGERALGGLATDGKLSSLGTQGTVENPMSAKTFCGIPSRSSSSP